MKDGEGEEEEEKRSQKPPRTGVIIRRRWFNFSTTRTKCVYPCWAPFVWMMRLHVALHSPLSTSRRS